jgi:hypothetical protein
LLSFGDFLRALLMGRLRFLYSVDDGLDRTSLRLSGGDFALLSKRQRLEYVRITKRHSEPFVQITTKPWLLIFLLT